MKTMISVNSEREQQGTNIMLSVTAATQVTLGLHTF